MTETSNMTHVCILVIIIKGMSFINLTKPVSRLRLFKTVGVKSIGVQRFLNGRHLETGLVRFMKLIFVAIHTKIHTYAKLKVSIFHEMNVTEEL
jgi:hypothetical protein